MEDVWAPRERETERSAEDETVLLRAAKQRSSGFTGLLLGFQNRRWGILWSGGLRVNILLARIFNFFRGRLRGLKILSGILRANRPRLGAPTASGRSTELDVVDHRLACGILEQPADSFVGAVENDVAALKRSDALFVKRQALFEWALAGFKLADDLFQPREQVLKRFVAAVFRG